jgi:hypothetical protein
MMKLIPWFERNLKFGLPREMFPYYLERLEGTYVRMEAKVKDIPDELFSSRLNGKWSVKENMGHLAEVDNIACLRLDEIITGVPVMSPAVFEPRDYNPWPAQALLILFQKARQRNLQKYRSLSEENLLAASLHPRLKVPMTPVDLAWFDAEHDDHHLAKISEIIFTLTKK